MATAVVLKGLPDNVPIQVLAYNLDKLFNTDEIGTFRVRDILTKTNNKWQVSIDFKTSYDAFTAQSILDKYQYTWTDGVVYVLKAKVSDDPDVKSDSWKSMAHEQWGHASSTELVPFMTSNEAKDCNNMLDAKLELLKKQKLILQTEREVIKEKRRLEREYRREVLTDSEDEVTKHRRHTIHRKRVSRDGESPKLKRSPSEDSGSKHKSRSSSKSRTTSQSILPQHENISGSKSPEDYTSLTCVRNDSTHYPRSKRPRFSEHSRSYRPISPEHSKSYRAVSPENARSYRPIAPEHSRTNWPISPEHSKSYRPVSSEYSRTVRPSYPHRQSPLDTRFDSLDYAGSYDVQRRSPDPPSSRSRCRSPDDLRRAISPERSRSYNRYRSPEHSRSPAQYSSREHTEPHARYSSPEHIKSTDRYMEHSRLSNRHRSPEHSRSFNRYESAENSRTSVRNRSPGHLSASTRYSSTEHSRTIRCRSPEYLREFDSYRSREHLRSTRHRSRSPYRTSSKTLEIIDLSKECVSLDKIKDTGKRQHDDHKKQITTKEDENTSLAIFHNIRTKYLKQTPPVTQCTEITDLTTPEGQIKTEGITIKEENVFENEPTDDELKNQINKAIRHIMIDLQVLVDKSRLQDFDKKRSVMKTLRSILARRLRSIKLNAFMIADDIVYAYKMTNSENDDLIIIQKLIDQLSGPKIEIDDAGVPDVEPELVQDNVDNKIWSILDEVLKDLQMEDFAAEDDDAETVIIKREDVDSEINDIANIDDINSDISHNNIKKEIIDAEYEDIVMVNNISCNDTTQNVINDFSRTVTPHNVIMKDKTNITDVSSKILLNNIKTEIIDANNEDIVMETEDSCIATPRHEYSNIIFPQNVVNERCYMAKPQSFINENSNIAIPFNIKNEVTTQQNIENEASVIGASCDIKTEVITENERNDNWVVGTQQNENNEVSTTQDVLGKVPTTESNANAQYNNQKPGKKKHIRNKINESTDLSQKVIPENPKFVITVKNVLQNMKPHVYVLRGDIKVQRILDITTFEIRKRIRKVVKGKPYMRSAEITALYRKRYPKGKDLKFVQKILKKIKKGVYSNLGKLNNNKGKIKKSSKCSAEDVDQTHDVPSGLTEKRIKLEEQI